ncbi:transposase [Enterococcus sp. AZ109]|uniref:transposase n=1 Tax=Enterococcus sp. AZ109 TaxID=2774634 RepID=UPI003F268B4F
MAFRLNSSQQLSLNDRFQQAPERTQKFVLKSWAKGFGDIVFPAICEERFAVLYSSDPASCPNTPVNILVGSLLLKELLQMTDEELLEAIVCGDLRFQYALHTTSFDEQPVSKNSFNRFRNRLYLHLLETGEDLLQQEMEALAEVFLQFLEIEPTMKRMDSLMVSANCRRMSRLELMYRCVQNLVKAIESMSDRDCPKDQMHYLDPTDANQVFYHDTDRDTPEKLDQLIQDAVSLKEELNENYHQLPDYQLLCQVLEEQTFTDDAGQTQQKPGQEITASSIQNPYDPEATYRKKAGKHHFGYVGNVVETVGDNGSIISQYDYARNIKGDQIFCKEVLEKLGEVQQRTTLISDGAFGSVHNQQQASKQNIWFVPTNLSGLLPDTIKGEFQINEDGTMCCPAGHLSYKRSFHKDHKVYCGWFDKATCEACPLLETCKPKLQKQAATVRLTKEKISRAQHLKFMESEEFQKLAHFRNGIEGVPSILRRRYHVDQIPVRGFLRTKIWFSFKIGAINIKNLIKGITDKEKPALLESSYRMKNFSQLFITFVGYIPKLIRLQKPTFGA